MHPRFQSARGAIALFALARHAARLAGNKNEECPQALKRIEERALMPELKLRPPKSQTLSEKHVLPLLLGMLALWPALAGAQQAPPGAIGQVEGNDVSVEGGTAAATETSTSAASIYVSNGSVVTVHSGQARMTLFAGGEVDICGPAKITVLKSGEAITLALNFGRMRVQLPAKTSLRVFTPTIIGTPLDISGGARDVTMGLNLDDSLCVVAGSGAIQLEHQFTGERLIVPQAGEFFLSSGKLVPVAGTPGSCQCVAAQPQPLPPPIPEYAEATPAQPVRPNVAPLFAQPPTIEQTPEAPLAEPSAEANIPPPRIEYSVPASVTEAHPVVPPAKETPEGAAPAVSTPTYTAVLPALTFSATAPVPPDDPTPDMTLLIRYAQVAPEWGFSGHVEPPEFVAAVQHALGVEPVKQQAAKNAPSEKKKKGGFWAGLKRLFGG
ncbi:MAG: hypothetical protein ABR973_10465 [Candidatus Acidiferrales bacterium]|jgi:hypothetical protein